jgi:hypothetical protein
MRVIGHPRHTRGHADSLAGHRSQEPDLASVGLRLDDSAPERAALKEKIDGHDLHRSCPDDCAAPRFHLLCDYSLHLFSTHVPMSPEFQAMSALQKGQG